MSPGVAAVRAPPQPRPPTRAGPAGRFFAGLVAIIALAAGLWLASHHPLGNVAACLLVIAAAASSAIAPRFWLLALPALLPVLAFAPWTGWTGIEETDLLVLAVLAGGYARFAGPPDAAMAPAPRASALPFGILLLLAGTVLVSLSRGIADAGGWPLLWRSDWTQGLREPLASVRLAKPLFMVLLLWPLWRRAQREAPEIAPARLSAGLALGLAAASLAALWERIAFTGLLNFSTDYRTTALFWEMQVGGAAFDGFLALTVPFALREWLAARSPARWLLASTLLLIALYACLTTFSRGVYLGIAIGLAVTIGLERARQRRHGAAPASPRTAGVVLLWLAGFGALAAWMFPTSGYRGVMAFWGACALLLPLGPLLPQMGRGERLGACALGLLLAAAVAAGSWAIPKGAYLLFALCALVTLAAVIAHALQPSLRAVLRVAALVGWIGTVAAIAMVALHWGDMPGLLRALPAVAALAIAAIVAGVVSARGGPSPWPAGWRWQGTLVATLVLAASGVGVLQGGAYLSDRFSTAGEDLAGRRQHWNDSLELMRDPMAWAFGIGLGRFPAQFALASPANARPADYRFVHDGEGGHLAIASGTHMNGWGEVFRISQRVAAPTGAVRAGFSVRTAAAVAVHLEVCEKHLLYNGNCLVHEVAVPADPAGATTWRPFETPLSGGTPTRGLRYAPRLIEFSIAVPSGGQRVEFDQLSLTDSAGRSLLANGDFEQRGAHWFSTSDRHHLPWHAKNMALHVLIEQGAIGLVLLVVVTAGAAWRTTFGHARDSVLAPPLAGALAGFLVVGLTDSLLDAARISLLMHLLLVVALTLPSHVAESRLRKTPS